MRKCPSKWRILFLFSIVTLVLSGCGKPFLSTLKPAGEVADTQYSLMLLSAGLMTIVVVVVSILFITAVIRYRSRKETENVIPKQVEGNHKLEIIWTVLPILLLIVLFVPTVSATFKLSDDTSVDQANEKDDAVVVNVRAHQYWWEFEYPNYGIITSQDLIVPTNEKVYFVLKASDVKHSFWIPAAGGKLDVNTDNDNKFYLEFDEEKTAEAGGILYGKCAELCGPSHALMDFKVKPLPRDEFDRWVKKMQSYEATATTDLAKKGEEIFNQSCIACHAVTPQDKRPQAARLAPNLANFGDHERIAGFLDHNKEMLKNWIKDPDKYKPGNKMAGTYGNLSDDEIDALAEYLMGLKID